MNNKNNLLRLGGCIFVAILTLSCYFFKSTPGTSKGTPGTSNPYVAPITNVPQAVTELSPLPDFPAEVLFFGYGGGGGGAECGRFTLPPIPSVIGGTTYPTSMVDYQSYSGMGPDFDYPRRAKLCLGGFPKDEQIDIKLISPDQNVTLSAAIQIVDDPLTKNDFLVKWAGYPAAWAEYNPPVFFNSIAARRGNNDDLNAPIIASLDLWWSGALERGTWKVEVSWPGQTIYGDFYAKTGHLPEISLGDPSFDTKLIPGINSDDPYTCRPARYEQPFFAILEAFPPNTPVYILVYRVTPVGAWDQGLALVYQTVIYSDGLGVGETSLSTNFSPGIKYYLFGTTDPSANLVVNTENSNSVFNFSAIANAMDCFFIP